MKILLSSFSILLMVFLMSCSDSNLSPMNSDFNGISNSELQDSQIFPEAKQSQNFKAHLNGAGAGTASKGQGQALFRFNNDKTELYFKLNLANIENVTMAHIHLGSAPGLNGPPVLWLYPDGPPPMLIGGTFNGTLAEGTVTSGHLVGPLAGLTLYDLQQAILEGLTYVNVHTGQFPGGEIRGEIK